MPDALPDRPKHSGRRPEALLKTGTFQNLTESGLKHQTDILDNGLTVVGIEMPHIHSVELALFVRAGLRFENEKNNGVFHFLEHMLFRGNEKFPDSASLNREFESLGRELRASTLSEYTYFGFSPHISGFSRAVELFADFFTRPTFSKIELERQIILEECQEELNEKGENVDIDDQACRLLYEGNPLSWQTIGTEATIAAMDEATLRQAFDEYYVAGNMVLAAAGPIRHEDFLALARRYFAHFPSGGRKIGRDHFQGSVNETQSGPRCRFQHDSDSQAQLQVCFRGVSYNHPDYPAACLINRVFDDGFTSRLQRALREDRGLVYSVECRTTSLSDIGTVDFDVSVRPEKLLEVTAILLAEIKAFAAEGPTDAELAHVKQRALFDLDVDRDGPYEQVARYGLSLLYSEPLSPEEEWLRIRSVTRDEVHALARRLFVPERLNLIVVGPLTALHRRHLEKAVLAY